MNIIKEELENVLNNHYQSKVEMAKALDISRSHLDKVFKNEGIGMKVVEGLKREAIIKGFSFEDLIEAPDIILENQKVKSIDVINEHGDLLASISSRDVILADGLDVVFNY